LVKFGRLGFDNSPGGAPEVQNEFLETLASDPSRRPPERHRKKPALANDFALGYTYQDVLDTDQEDTLARLSIYTLSEPSLAFAPLLTPLLNKQTIPETLLIILLDWAEPWKWVRQIRDWIWLLREVLSLLDDVSKQVMQETIREWEQRRRGGMQESGALSGASSETLVAIPLGPGEWDEALGLPLCVVCHNVGRPTPQSPLAAVLIIA
jgi:dynein light intermediate chain 1